MLKEKVMPKSGKNQKVSTQEIAGMQTTRKGIKSEDSKYVEKKYQIRIMLFCKVIESTSIQVLFSVMPQSTCKEILRG